MWEPRLHPGVFVGMLNSSSEAAVVTEQGLAIKTHAANVRRIPESERLDADRILGMRAVPRSPDGSDNAFDVQVGMDRPAEMVPRHPGEVLMENKAARTYLRRADFEQWSPSEGCLGCWYLIIGQGRQEAAGDLRACWKATRLDPHDWLRLPKESVVHWLVPVERHATKDPGMRGILKRASVVCCPESNVRRKLQRTQSRTRHHTLQSHKEDHQHQVHIPASPQALTRTPTLAT